MRNRQCSCWILVNIWSATPSLKVLSEFREPEWAMLDAFICVEQRQSTFYANTELVMASHHSSDHFHDTAQPVHRKWMGHVECRIWCKTPLRLYENTCSTKVNWEKSEMPRWRVGAEPSLPGCDGATSPLWTFNSNIEGAKNFRAFFLNAIMNCYDPVYWHFQRMVPSVCCETSEKHKKKH